MDVQIVLGIAAYSHSFLVNSSSAFDASKHLALYPPSYGTPSGDKWDSVPGELSSLSREIQIRERVKLGPDQCGTMIDHPGGVFTFWGLVDAGFLEPNGKHAAGIHYIYDNCTQTVRALPNMIPDLLLPAVHSHISTIKLHKSTFLSTMPIATVGPN